MVELKRGLDAKARARHLCARRQLAAARAPRPARPSHAQDVKAAWRVTRLRRRAGARVSGAADGHWQDHHAAGAYHVVPAGAPGVRQAHLLHAHGARDGKGARPGCCAGRNGVTALTLVASSARAGAGGASRAAGVSRAAGGAQQPDLGARAEQPQEHVHPPEGAAGRDVQLALTRRGAEAPLRAHRLPTKAAARTWMQAAGG